jgi:hypothetical protein
MSKGYCNQSCKHFKYKLMYQLLDELSTNDEANTSTNNGTVVVVTLMMLFG